MVSMPLLMMNNLWSLISLSRPFDRKNDAARATRDFDRAGLSEDPSVSSTMAANAASSRESLRFFSLDRCKSQVERELAARAERAEHGSGFFARCGGGGVSRGSSGRMVSAGPRVGGV